MKANKVIGIGVGILIIFTLIAALYPSMADESDKLTAEGNCEAASTTCFYNASRTIDCTENNETPTDTTECTANNYVRTGLNESFGSEGVIFIVMGITLFIGIVLLVIRLKRK